MSTPFLVTGGTGGLGRLVVPRLLKAGVEARVLTRSLRDSEPVVEYVTGDVSTGEGLEGAIGGVHTILHLAGSAKGDGEKARHLTKAAVATGVKHIVFVSVVGADRVPIEGRIDRAAFGYYGEKYAAEQVIADSGTPWTTLRATQFHSLALLLAEQMGKLPIAPYFSGMKMQPVDPGDVADRLVELTLGEPAGLVPDIGGPHIYEMKDLISSYLSARGKRRPQMPIRMPGQAAQALREGANLTPDHAVGDVTWEEFLSNHVPV